MSSAERLHERQVVGILGPVARQVDRLEEADLELRRQVHQRRGEPELRERVVDREVDEPGQPLQQRHVGEDRHRLLGADHRDRHDRHAGAHRGPHEAAAPEAAQPVALPVELARALLALREHEHEPALVAQQALGVGRVGRHQPDLVGQHAHARIALEPVLAEHVHRPRARVLVADRLHDHRRVRRQRAGVVRHDQRAALGGHVLDALRLDAEPVAVVEVEQRLDQVEHALRAAPVVELRGPARRPAPARAGRAARLGLARRQVELAARASQSGPRAAAPRAGVDGMVRRAAGCPRSGRGGWPGCGGLSHARTAARPRSAAAPSTMHRVAGRGLAAHERERDRPEAGGDAGRADPAHRPCSPSTISAPRSAGSDRAGRAGGGWACPCSAGARRSPGRRSSPCSKLTARSLMPASWGIVSASMSSPSRGRPDSMRRHSAASSDDLLDAELARAAPGRAWPRMSRSTPRSVRTQSPLAGVDERVLGRLGGGSVEQRRAPRARSATASRGSRRRPPSARRARACRC